MLIAQGLFGLVVLTVFCWLISENRRAPWIKTAIVGLVLQFVLAALFL
ncbi:MAG: Na+ dependent nucleoside transporter N-terminus, partial [Rhodospirillales bacterium]|nr:Na+ dependent nucleoside transporter N-terminus [Rhodospirillales bacterium]